MKMGSAEAILDMGADLVITVDNGIASLQEIQYLMDEGVDVIVTDHHMCKESLPAAVAVLDNQRSDNTYPFPPVCGAVMAYKLITALYAREGLAEPENLLPYAALATIADVMPLKNENRLIVKRGMDMMPESVYPGVRRLYQAALAKKSNTQAGLTATDLAFYAAPLINASSRVGDVRVAMDLLLSDDEEQAEALALQMIDYNEKRKRVEKLMTEEAFTQVMDTYDFQSNAPIVVWGEDWHKGVIGIVASRIVDKFHRPAFVFGGAAGGVYHGSARGCGDNSVMDMLNFSKDALIQYGGHFGAAGMSAYESDLPRLRKMMEQYGVLYMKDASERPRVEIDLEVEADELIPETFAELSEFEPFGEGNREPLLLCRNLDVRSIRKVGNDYRTLSAAFTAENSRDFSIKGVGFRKSEFADMIPRGEKVDVVFTLGLNTYKGITSVQMMLKDILYQQHFEEGTTTEDDQAYLDEVTTIRDLCEEYGLRQDTLCPLREEYGQTYNILRALFQKDGEIVVTSLDYLAPVISKGIGRSISPFKLSRILEVLAECGGLQFKRGNNGQIVFRVWKTPQLTPVSETEAYKKMQRSATGQIALS